MLRLIGLLALCLIVRLELLLLLFLHRLLFVLGSVLLHLWLVLLRRRDSMTRIIQMSFDGVLSREVLPASVAEVALLVTSRILVLV